MPDAMDCSSSDVILPVVPMFHVNAWGLPYSAAMVGAKLVFPGPHLDGKSLHDLFESEQVTFSAGVPTVWLGAINYMKANNLKVTSLKRTVIGGSACPPAMIDAFAALGVRVIHAWGMTELSPQGTLSPRSDRPGAARGAHQPPSPRHQDAAGAQNTGQRNVQRQQMVRGRGPGNDNERGPDQHRDNGRDHTHGSGR